MLEKSVNHFEKDQELDKNLSVNCKSKLRELLADFRPETMSKEEKVIFIEKLSKIIVSYALNSIHNEVKLEKFYFILEKMIYYNI